MKDTIENLLAAAKEAAENPPTREKVMETIECLAKTYPGFKEAGYETIQQFGDIPCRHYVSASFDDREPIVAADFDVAFAVCLLNAKLMRYFLKPQEEAA